jgi:hypothetical protein
MRVTTDLAAERSRTVVAKFEIGILDAFEKMSSGLGAPMDADTLKQMDEPMKEGMP